MSFVPEREAHNFHRQFTTFWCHLIQRDITSPLFFLPLKLGGLGVGSAVQRHAAAPWRAWQSIIPTLNQQPSHRTQIPLQRNTTTKSSTGTTPNHPLTTNEQTSLPTHTTWSSSSPKNHSKETSLPNPKEYTQATLQQPRRHPR